MTTVADWIVEGRSMEPTLRAGCRARIDASRPLASARPGDIVAVEAPGGRMVLHRLLRRGRKSLRTQGDRSPRLDPAYPADCFRGVLQGVQDRPGSPWRRPASWEGRLALAIRRIRRPNRLALLLLGLSARLAWRPAAMAPARAGSPAPPPGRVPLDSLPEWIEVQPIGEEVLLVDRRDGSVLALNPSAQAVLALARQGLGEPEIAGSFQARFPSEPPESVRADVAEAFRRIRAFPGLAPIFSR